MLVNGPRAAGTYAIEWDGRSQDGHPMSSGMYFYRLETLAGSQSRQLMLLQ